MKDISIVHNAKLGHIGGEYSITDILVTLYLGVLKLSPKDLDNPDRDVLILSKGHTAVALYCTLARAGLLDVDLLETFAQPGSLLNGHPARTKVKAVEANTGPLGHGLPQAVGNALGQKLRKNSSRVFVLTGDGEMQEGSNWEALMCAAHYKLNNLTLIIDRNHLQQGASTEATNDLSPLDEKLRAFGWEVVDIDGHNYDQILDACTQNFNEEGKPRAIIAHTHKGYPISFMRDQAPWHHKIPTQEERDQALKELSYNE